MGMRALAIDAEAVECRGMRRREIAVGAAAGEGVDEFKTGRFNSPTTLTLTPSVRDFKLRILGTRSSASAIEGTRISTSA